MRVVIVGAGAVGRVYARHFALGGAEVSFLVRPGRAAQARRGGLLTPLNEGRLPVPVRFPAATAPPVEVDLIVLAVPSDALRGRWIREVLIATSGATVLLLSPGLDDAEWVVPHVAEGRLVQGRIGLIAWRAPLPGERLVRSVAYWNPPGRAPVWGPAAAEVAALLTDGGLPTRVVRRAPSRAGSALLTPLVAALGSVGWSLAGLRESGLLPVLARAMREAMQATESPWWAPAVRGLTLGWALALLPDLVPFPLEAYLKRHFHKLLPQTLLQLEAFIERAPDDSGALRVLRDRLVGRSPSLLSGWESAGAPLCISISS